MKKAEQQAIADKFFELNPKAEKCFVSSTGFCFATGNSADLHKNTAKGDKKPMITEFTNSGVESTGKSGGSDVIEFPLTEKTVKKMKLPQLQQMAEDLKIDATALDSKAKLAAAINELKAKED